MSKSKKTLDVGQPNKIKDPIVSQSNEDQKEHTCPSPTPKSGSKSLKSPQSTSSFDTSRSTLNPKEIGNNQEKNPVEAFKKLMDIYETLVGKSSTSSNIVQKFLVICLLNYSNN